MPWCIGLIVILAGMIFFGFWRWASSFGVSLGLDLIALVLMPVVYLVLMYLTLTSQE